MSKGVLAQLGGEPVRRSALPSWPKFAADEVAAVMEVLQSGRVNYWTGEQGRRFEDEYADYLGVSKSIACANGTVALELGLRTLGIRPGDDVIVPAKTFIASASAIVAVGARPVVADVDTVSQNLTVATLSAAMTTATRAIVVVHLGGWPADMPAIMAFADIHGLKVIEDCAQAHGAYVDDQPVGSFGDCAAFSFCQDKIITTGGEGGLLAFREDEDAWERAWAYKDHGKSFRAVHRQDHPPGFRWLHESFGTNMRMTEMQAVLGSLQLSKLPMWQQKRAANAGRLHAGLADCPGLRLAFPAKGVVHAWYRYYAFLDLPMLASGWTQNRVIEAINAEGVPAFVGSCSEIYREEAFVASGYAPSKPLPVASQLSDSSLAFLVHPTLELSDIDDTVTAIRKVMTAAVAQ